MKSLGEYPIALAWLPTARQASASAPTALMMFFIGSDKLPEAFFFQGALVGIGYMNCRLEQKLADIFIDEGTLSGHRAR